MNPATQTNGTGTITAEEQQIVYRIRQLPLSSLPLVVQYLELLATRQANPGSPDASTPAQVATLLASEDFRRIVGHLPPVTAELILEFAIFVAADATLWDYDNPVSLSLATTLMGLDPFLHRESMEQLAS